MMRPLFFLAAVTLVLVCCRREPGKTATPLPADAVATVGPAVLVRTDLDHALASAGARPPADVLRALADDEALAQLAVKEGLDRDPSVRAAIRRMLGARLLEKEASPVTVTDAEVAAAVKALPLPAARPATRHLAFLRRKYQNDTEKAEAKAVLEKARAAFQALPADPQRSGFGPLAVEASDDGDTRYQGGDAGWAVDGTGHLLLPAEATRAAAALSAPGLVAEIIFTKEAAWLVLVSGIKPAASAPVDAAKVRATLLAEKEKAQRENLARRAREAAPVTLLVTPPTPAAQVPAASPQQVPPAHPQ